MSHSEWEEGEIKLSTADFPKMRKALVAFHNAQQDSLFALAQRLHTQLTQGTREERKQPLSDRLDRLLTAQRLDNGAWGRITGALVKRDSQTGKARLRAPLKKEFQHAKSSSLVFSNGEASVTFEPKTRRVHWHVSENNHAVDQAWESPLGRAFQRALGQMTWTRGTGGHFRYLDEHMRDEDHHAAGRGSRISRRFGPLGDQAYEAQIGFRLRKPSTGRR